MVRTRGNAGMLCPGWLLVLEPPKRPDVAVQIRGTRPRITQRRAAYGCVWFGQKLKPWDVHSGKVGGDCNDGDYRGEGARQSPSSWISMNKRCCCHRNEPVFLP